MAKIELSFTKPTALRKRDIAMIKNILVYLDNQFENTYIKMGELFWKVGITVYSHQEIRKFIQLHRETATSKLWGHKGYIIASRDGYKLTTNKKEIEQYVKGTRARAVSSLKQVDEAWKMINKKGW